MKVRGSVYLAAAIALAAVMTNACSSDDEAPKTAAVNPACAGTPAGEVPEDLSCTGLYSDFATKTLAPTSRPYAPAVSFWSDGYEKERFITLPDGMPINAANVDDWSFPVGTKVWKEIHQGPRKIETRFFQKISDDTWLQASYVWSEDGQRAIRGEGSDINVNGTPYHVPKTNECNECHRGRKDKLLGFEAISLSQPAATGLNLGALMAENRIQPLPSRPITNLPDAAYGVLHVNCGITCHNGQPNSKALSTGLRLRLGFEEVTKPPAEWEAFKTAVNIEAKMPGWSGETRVIPGSPETSLIIQVMKLRGEGQMPPIATNAVDTVGVGAIENWIRTLPPAAAPATP